MITYTSLCSTLTHLPHIRLPIKHLFIVFPQHPIHIPIHLFHLLVRIRPSNDDFRIVSLGCIVAKHTHRHHFALPIALSTPFPTALLSTITYPRYTIVRLGSVQVIVVPREFDFDRWINVGFKFRFVQVAMVENDVKELFAADLKVGGKIGVVHCGTGAVEPKRWMG